jgi:hypothetical protein
MTVVDAYRKGTESPAEAGSVVPHKTKRCAGCRVAVREPVGFRMAAVFKTGDTAGPEPGSINHQFLGQE